MDNWVKELVMARATSRRFVPSDNRPSTADEAYQIQAGVAQRVGAVGGFKTARKGGAPSIMAPVFAAGIIPSSTQISVVDRIGIELEVGTVTAQMQAGTEVVLDGAGTVPDGSALETFASLTRQIGDHCGGLKRGQIVITGSLHPLAYYPKGTLIQGRIDGIGAVSVRLDA